MGGTRLRVARCTLGLPGLNGAEVCGRLLAGAHDVHLARIAATGWGQESDRRRTRDAGFHHRLVKPVSREQRTSLLVTVGEADPALSLPTRAEGSTQVGDPDNALSSPAVAARSMRHLLTKFVDVRVGEGALAAKVFALLMLIVAGHTALETARDALFLTRMPPNALNLLYVGLALLSFVVAGLSDWLVRRVGRRRALVGALASTAVITLLLRLVPATRAFATGLYLYAGVVGSLLTTQAWVVIGQVFTTGQGRRLLGAVAAGGVLGGVAGAGVAALVLEVASLRSLLLLSAAMFGAGAVVAAVLPAGSEVAAARPAQAADVGRSLFKEQPFLLRLGLLSVLSTATFLLVDFLFKSTVARTLPAAELGPFFARFYALTNAAALVVQLLVSTRVLRRLGVLGAVSLTPLLLLAGGLATTLSGALVAVVAAKAIDGALRFSLNSVATELFLLPLPADARARGKIFFDGVVVRVVKAATGMGLYALGVYGLATTRLLGLLMAALALAWLLAVVASRNGYLALLRGALAGGRLHTVAGTRHFDLASAETLVDALASRDPATVIAAMDLLVHKGRARLIPALVLFHESDEVLVHALEIFADRPSGDWLSLVERLLESPHQRVRVAAIRALARRGSSTFERSLEDPSPWVQAYAATHHALLRGRELTSEPTVASLLQAPDETQCVGRAALLAAVADNPSSLAAEALLVLAADAYLRRDPEAVANLLKAMVALGDRRFVAVLIDLLGVQAVRGGVRETLLMFGDVAFEALLSALRDPSTSRRLRVHIPRSLARFGTQAACDRLTDLFEQSTDGLLRFKALRGLGALVDKGVRFDHRRLERALERNLDEQLRLLGQRVALAGSRGAPGAGPPSETFGLLVGLLDAKIEQALERSFRLLKLLYQRENLHGVYDLVRRDPRGRGNALEFLDELLAGPGHQEMRSRLRILLDDTDDAERVRRATPFVGAPPGTREQALASLTAAPDEGLSALAAAVASGAVHER